MKFKRKLFFISILSICLISCNKLEDTAVSNSLPSLLGLNKEGKVVVLDTSKSDLLMPCSQNKMGQERYQSDKNNNPCKIEIIEKDGRTVILKNGKEDPTAKVTKIVSVAFQGSHCVAHKAGKQYEICWPW
jgi:hypothetical protein